MPSTEALSCNVANSGYDDAFEKIFPTTDLGEQPFTEGLDKILGMHGNSEDDIIMFDDLFATDDGPFHGMQMPEDDETSMSSSSNSPTPPFMDWPEYQIKPQQGLKKGKIKSNPEKVKFVPKKPKRSLSAYNLFFQAERKNLLECLPVQGVKPRRSHGKLGFAEMARTIASKWKKISKEDKKEFELLAASDGERYESEMADWRKLTEGYDLPQGKKGKKSKKITTKGSSNKLFGFDAEEPVDAMGFDTVTLDALLEDTSFLDNIQGFQELMTAPTLSKDTQEDGDFHTPEAKQQSNDEEKKKAKGRPKKDKKGKKEKKDKRKPPRSLSSYNIFFQAHRKKLLEGLPVNDNKPRRSHGKIGFAEMARTIAAEWKKISPEDKMHYDHLSALDVERYEREKEVYFKILQEEEENKSKNDEDKSRGEDKKDSDETTIESDDADDTASEEPSSDVVASSEQLEKSNDGSAVTMFLRKTLCRSAPSK